MEEDTRKHGSAEDLLKNLSVCVSAVSFWVIAFSWNYLPLDDLELVPRLGMGAALSWIVFLHVEMIGMIIMTMMRDKWRSEGQEARLYAREARARAAEAEAREAEARAREAQAEAREAEAEAREAQAQLVILDLRRQLREARGEDANGAEGA